MIANDCQIDFERIQRSKSDAVEGSRVNGSAGNVANGGGKAPDQRKEFRNRKGTQANGHASPAPASDQRDKYFWQTYPSSFSMERLDWILDVFTNFRGIGWNWQTNGVPPPPAHVEAQLAGRTDAEGKDGTVRTSMTGVRRYSDRTKLLRAIAINLAYSYVALDVVKAIMHHDPYFWGYVDAPAPAWLPVAVRSSLFLTKTWRLLISLWAIYTALCTVFRLGPAFFCGILGSEWAGLRGEAWMNPYDMYGAYSNILDKGLAGWWGGWWHQIFRFGFEAPATGLLAVIGVDKRKTTGKVISLLMAFFLSGCLHASGSYTQLGDTRPLLGPMRFFLLQAFGIMLQIIGVEVLKRTGVVGRCPKVVRRFANFVLVHVWLFYTAPLLVDDFARGGIWLFEPVAISPLRGLGFGQPDDGWWCWEHQRIWWRSGKHWWDTGIVA
ncbi:hypothetical protein B0A50_03305 [Salinomyces thailandicus]|uniref:Wax synthase domain-containing protein n=1 Tax=Salinomyces thailandicus TaxID=706561 RepID=A0A4U0U2B8_9PEZI|nr:hypothetical protein B0A50_03305 [Salinomyces thailandica]